MEEKIIINETFFWKQKPDRARCASHLLGVMLAKVQGGWGAEQGKFSDCVDQAVGTTIRDVTRRLILEHRRGRMQL